MRPAAASVASAREAASVAGAPEAAGVAGASEASSAPVSSAARWAVTLWAAATENANSRCASSSSSSRYSTYVRTRRAKAGVGSPRESIRRWGRLRATTAAAETRVGTPPSARHTTSHSLSERSGPASRNSVVVSSTVNARSAAGTYVESIPRRTTSVMSVLFPGRQTIASSRGQRSSSRRVPSSTSAEFSGDTQASTSRQGEPRSRKVRTTRSNGDSSEPSGAASTAGWSARTSSTRSDRSPSPDAVSSGIQTIVWSGAPP